MNSGNSSTMKSESANTGGPMFGAKHSGKPASSGVSKWNQGSAATMERTQVSNSNDIAFGNKASSKSKHKSGLW